MSASLELYNKPLKLIIKTFEELGGSAPLSKLYKKIENSLSIDFSKNRNEKNKAEARIRATIERYSSDSDIYSGRENIFFSINGKGKGVWGLTTYAETTPRAIDLGNVKDEKAPERVKEEIFRVLRDADLTRKIKLVYHHRCQVCGQSIILKESNYSEAHHIKPLGGEHGGFDCVANIIVLCPNHHVEFDYGAIAINPETLSLVHIDRNSVFNGKKLVLYDHHLDKDFLKYHFEKIYKG